MADTKLVIGIDEAGYGPSMGPLTIGATAWRVPTSLDLSTTFNWLEPEISDRPWNVGAKHVCIGDSKKVHTGPYALEGLYLGALFLGHTYDEVVSTDWNDRISQFANEDCQRLSTIPWYEVCSMDRIANFRSLIPDVSDYFRSATNKLKQHAMSCVGLRMRVIDEIEFNTKVNQLQKKSNLLSEASLNLAKHVVATFGDGQEWVEIYCDKHGGRDRYQAILTHVFDNEWFDVIEEGRQCSRYQANWNGHRMTIQFRVEGDSIFPAAASSILAKWTREVMMSRLNRFWSERCDVPIKPTAGYYVDATRFATAIEPTAARLKLSRERWWRIK